jgi:hypothetical protein
MQRTPHFQSHPRDRKWTQNLPRGPPTSAKNQQTCIFINNSHKINKTAKSANLQKSASKIPPPKKTFKTRQTPIFSGSNAPFWSKKCARKRCDSCEASKFTGLAKIVPEFLGVLGPQTPDI